MVLESLYPISWLQKRKLFAFLLGLTYSIIGIGIALLIFPDSPSLVAVAFTSILLLPTLYSFLRIEEQQEENEKTFTLRKLWRDSKSFILFYLFVLIGSEIAFTLLAIYFPQAATSHIFKEQILMRTVSGNAAFSQPLFFEIFFNNIKILFLCFIISLLTGDGAIFFLIWNTSVWGTIFGTLAKTAAANVGNNPIIYYIIIFFSVLPHGIMETVGYVGAAIAGGVISRSFSRRHFSEQKNEEVIKYNIGLIVVGVLFVLVAAIVETFVLQHNAAYRMIILQSMRP